MSESNNQSATVVQNPRVTSEGCSVLLDINDGDRLVFARLSTGAYVFCPNFDLIHCKIIYCIGFGIRNSIFN